MAEASRRASTNSSQTHLMSSMSRNSPSGSSQNMRVSVWWCTRTSSNPFHLRSSAESSVYFALRVHAGAGAMERVRSARATTPIGRGRRVHKSGRVGDSAEGFGGRRAMRLAVPKDSRWNPPSRMRRNARRRETHHSSASFLRVGDLLYMCSTRSMTAMPRPISTPIVAAFSVTRATDRRRQGRTRVEHPRRSTSLGRNFGPFSASFSLNVHLIDKP